MHPLCNQSFSFWYASGTSSTGPLRHTRSSLKLFGMFQILGFRMQRTDGTSSLTNLLVAPCFGKPVARRSKILVPCLREAGDDLLCGLPCDLHPGMDDVSPGVHARAFSYVLFETDPLRQHDTQRVVDPAHLMRWLTVRYDVTHNRLHWLQDFDFQPASRFPRPSFSPVQLAIDVCEFIPSPVIRKNLPGEFSAGLGGHTILKSKHILLFRTPVFPQFWGSQREPFGAYSLYTVSLTL